MKDINYYSGLDDDAEDDVVETDPREETTGQRPAPQQVRKGPPTEPVVVLKLHCVKCGHDWFPRNPEKMPTRCPSCKNSRFWLPKTPNAERRGRKKKIRPAESAASGTQPN